MLWVTASRGNLTKNTEQFFKPSPQLRWWCSSANPSWNLYPWKPDSSSCPGHKPLCSHQRGPTVSPGAAWSMHRQAHAPSFPVRNEAQLAERPFPAPRKNTSAFCKSKQKAPNFAPHQNEKWAFFNSQQIRPCLSKPKLLDLTSRHTAELLLPFSQP